MNSVFIQSGHGYEVSDRGRCTAFDGFEVIAAPLPGYDEAGRESRIFGRGEHRGGTCYGAYTVALARREHDSNLYLLVQHGGGREVWRVPNFWDGRALERYILDMPERLQFGLLFTLYAIARDARSEAQVETARKWKTAFLEDRLKKRRVRGSGAVRVEMVE